MSKVKIIVKGYAKILENGNWDATSNTILIETGKYKVLVDPGCNRKLLNEGLEKENLTPKDIDYVFLTHYHLDHFLLIGIFEEAMIVDGTQWQKDSVGGDLKENFIPNTDIEIIKAPGHTQNNAVLLVKTERGKVVVGADVFWWKDGEQQILDVGKVDEFAEDQGKLVESRKKILKLGDFIIPGHGKMFKVEKNKYKIACAIIINDNGDILLTKRGRDPFKGKWALISGIGESIKGFSPEKGIVEEVRNDLGTDSFKGKYSFRIPIGNDLLADENVVLVGKIDEKAIKLDPKFSVGIKWVSEKNIKEFEDLAFEHSEIIKKYLNLKER